MSEPVAITMDQQIAALEKEITLRRIFYPKGFAGAPMKKADADHEIAAMTAAMRTIMALKDGSMTLRHRTPEDIQNEFEGNQITEGTTL